MTTNKDTKVIATKFVKWDVPELETLKTHRVYALRERLNAGKAISRQDKNWITKTVNNNAYFSSAIPLYGYSFDFSDILKIYIVKQYDSYQAYKAIDKTSLRAMIYGKIDKIIEEK